MSRMLAALVILTLALVAPILGDDRLVAAQADHDAIKALGTDDYLFVRYAIFPPDESIEAPVDWRIATNFTLPSCSILPNLNRQLAQRVAAGCWRFDLRGLGWDPTVFAKFLADEKYPYGTVYNPLYIHGPWLLAKLSDASGSVAYETLPFGTAGRPKNRDEFLARLGVDRAESEKQELNHGLIEGNSGVAVQSGAEGQKIRVLESIGRLGGYHWGTRDFLEITPENSPLEYPDLKGIEHDGEEHITGVPKSWYADPAYGIASSGRGASQFYFLADGKGNLVTEAPAKLVEDHSKFGGVSSIRTPGSCVSCHDQGLLSPKVNLLQAWIEAGVELKAKDYEAQQFLERFHLGGVGTEIQRANEDFAAFVQAACGCAPAEAVRQYRAANDWYRADVTLDSAAIDLGCDADELKLALAYASENGLLVGGHLSALAEGRPMGRATWEGLYLKAAGYLAAWRNA